MTIRELNREQLIQVKQYCLTDRRDEAGEGISYDELARADEIITDEEIFRLYEDTEFTEADFY